MNKQNHVYMVTLVSFVVAEDKEQAKLVAVKNAQVDDCAQVIKQGFGKKAYESLRFLLKQLDLSEWLIGSPYGNHPICGEMELGDIIEKSLLYDGFEELPDAGRR